MVDKAILPRVQDMDAMIWDAHTIEECTHYIRADDHHLKHKIKVFRSGTKEGIVHQLAQVVDAHQT